MSNPAPICTYIKTNGIRCGSPAVSETEYCHHHSAIKTATRQAASKPRPGSGGFAPIPFVFPEDRASMQINFYLLLQAFNQGQIDLKHFKSMMSMLKAMKANLGKTGSLIDQPSDQQSAINVQKSDGGPLKPASGLSGEHEQKDRHSAISNHDAPSEAPFEFSPELFAEFEEIEKLSPTDPTYAARIRAAVAEGTKELKAQGLHLMDIAPVAGLPVR